FPAAPCKFPSGSSFNGIHQPDITESQPIVALSFFNDRLGLLGLPKRFTLDDIKLSGMNVCNHPSSYSNIFKQNPLFCLDITYIYSLLLHGFKLRPTNYVTCAKKINGFEAGWALGSALQLLEGSSIEDCP